MKFADGHQRISLRQIESASTNRKLANRLDILGFIGDIGAGLLYFLARVMSWGIGNIHRAVADYGTKYIVVAGLLNIVATVDAYHIAIGKKQ